MDAKCTNIFCFIFFNFVFFWYFLFCVLCVTFAPSAFKNPRFQY